jgi:hypothetical protein
MTSTQVEEMRQFLAKMGVSEATVTHPTTTLEDLFVRVVRENTPALAGDGGNGQGQSQPLTKEQIRMVNQ